MSEDRVRALREAASQLDPSALRHAASLTRGPLAAWLDAVAKAAESPDPGLALEALLSSGQGPEALLRLTETAGEGLRGQILALRLRLDGLTPYLDQVGRRQQTLSELYSTLDASGDLELDALLDSARGLLDKQPSPETLQELRARLDRLLRDLDSVAKAERAQPSALASLSSQALALQDTLTRLESASAVEPVLALLDQAAALARTRALPRQLDLQLSAAAAAERLYGPQLALPRWRALRTAALAQGAADPAWTATKHLQLAAIAAQDWREVAALAHHVADLLSGTERGLIARLEEAQALARLPEHHDSARLMAEHTQREARSFPEPVQARVLLMVAQVYALLDQKKEAIHRLRRAMELGREGPPEVLGRAALYLGQLEGEAGHSHQAGKNLLLAWKIANTQGDWSLFASTTPALVDHLHSQGKTDEARALLEDAMRRAGSGSAGDQFRREAQARWSGVLL